MDLRDAGAWIPSRFSERAGLAVELGPSIVSYDGISDCTDSTHKANYSPRADGVAEYSGLAYRLYDL